MSCFLGKYTEIGITLGFSISERFAWLIAFISVIWLIGKAIEHRKK